MNKSNKKWIIIVPILLVLIVAVAITLLLMTRNNRETTYTAYVDINPLIKLNFKVSCDKDNCNEPIITDYELINEDAKTIYKDLVIKDKTLKETIELLGNTVKDKEIVFKEVHIYTNYDNEDYFKLDSVDYNITFDVKDDKDLEQFIDELIVKKENIITKEVLLPIIYYPLEGYYTGNPIQMVGMKQLEHDELFITEEETIYFEDGFEPVDAVCIGFASGPVCDVDAATKITIPTAYVKVTISGPKDMLDTIPDKINNRDTDTIRNYVYTDIKPDDISLGEHIVYLEFISNIEDVKVLTEPIKMRVELQSMKNRGKTLKYNKETNTYKLVYFDENGKLIELYNVDALKEMGVSDEKIQKFYSEKNAQKGN